MTTLTSVKYITQQELLDVLPRTMYGEKESGAPGPQLGHTMPVGLPFWLGVNKPFNLVKLKRKKKHTRLNDDSILPWQHCSWTLPYNDYRARQKPKVCCRLYKEENNDKRFGSATMRLWLDFVYAGASWNLFNYAFLEFCELKMRRVLPLSAGCKLELQLQGSVDLEKTHVNLSPSSLLGQSWLTTSEASVTQGLNLAALHSLPYAATGNLWPQVHWESHTCVAASKTTADSVMFLNCVVPFTNSV